MSLFNRYVFRQTAGAIVLILSTLIIIIWVSVALKEINVLTKDGQGTGIFFYLTILALPRIIGVVMPVALLISCIHVLNKLNGDSEIIVMTASGAGRWQLAKPLLILSLIISMLVLANNAYLQPLAQRELRHYTTKIRTDLLAHVIQPGKFTSAVSDMTFHIRARDENGDILGFLLHDRRKPEEQLTYTARRSKLVEKDGTTYMVMYEGHIFRQAANSREPQVVKFDNYLFDLSQFEPAGKSQTFYKTHESYLGELYSPDPANPNYKSRPNSFRAELHDRLSNPLYPVLFTLIAVASLGYARTTRANRMKSIILGFAFGGAARLAGLSAVNLAGKHAFAVALVWGIPLFGMLAAATVIQMRGIDGVWRQRSAPRKAITVAGGAG